MQFDFPATPVHKRRTRVVVTPMTPPTPVTPVRRECDKRTRRHSTVVLESFYVTRTRKDIACLSHITQRSAAKHERRLRWLKKMLWKGILRGMRVKQGGDAHIVQVFVEDYEDLMHGLEDHVVKLARRIVVKLKHYKSISDKILWMCTTEEVSYETAVHMYSTLSTRLLIQWETQQNPPDS